MDKSEGPEFQVITKYMYTLTYESIEAYELSSDEMELLLEKSQKNNREIGISGCLIYYRGRFVQILEGERNQVLELYDKIKVDPRHTEVHMFSDDTIAERTFPNWGMAFYPLDKSDFSKSELEQFRRNLLLLCDLTEAKHLTARLFWRRIKMYLDEPRQNPISSGSTLK